MKRALVLFATLALGSPVYAQTAASTGVGVGVANSNSQSGAVAISGQGGKGGNSKSSINITNPAATSSTSVNRTEVSGTQTLKNVPTAVAPSLAAAGLETCLGSVSGGGAFVGTGFSFGTTVPDVGCAARLDARTLWSMGLKKAAVARLCLMPDIAKSMPDICAMYVPRVQGVTVAEAYGGGPIEVIMQATGQRKMCATYDASKHRCRVWAR